MKSLLSTDPFLTKLLVLIKCVVKMYGVYHGWWWAAYNIIPKTSLTSVNTSCL